MTQAPAPRRVLLALLGDSQAADPYQRLQEQDACEEAERQQFALEVLYSPGFDHLRVVRKRLGDTRQPPVDAVVIEPASESGVQMLVRELRGRCGLVLLNAWAPGIQQDADWHGRPFGTYSTDHGAIGTIQGRQINALLPAGGAALCITGPLRSNAAAERLAALRSALRPGIVVHDAEGGNWSASDGGNAFLSWYRVHKDRRTEVQVLAGQSDDLVMGAAEAVRAVSDPVHAQRFRQARLLGVDACPAFGRRLVDEGVLAASVTNPANAGEALRGLARFWRRGEALPLRGLTRPTPYPLHSTLATR
jgi:ABC-type sugar transport system substrate-binding protein